MAQTYAKQWLIVYLKFNFNWRLSISSGNSVSVQLVVFPYNFLNIWMMIFYKNISLALTSVAQLVGPHPANWKVAGLIPSQGTCLGCRPGPQLGHVQKVGDRCFSITLLFLSLLLSLKINLKNLKKKEYQFNSQYH